MSAVMCVALKSRVTSPGVLFVNWTIALLVRRLSRLKSAGCAAAMLSRRQTGGGAEPTSTRCVRERVQELLSTSLSVFFVGCSETTLLTFGRSACRSYRPDLRVSVVDVHSVAEVAQACLLALESARTTAGCLRGIRSQF